MTNNWDKRDITNNNGKSGPVIISAECRVSRVGDKKLHYYDCMTGQIVSTPYRVTIHNYESEALGYDPTIKSEQNYYRFLHLSTLLHKPWGMSVKFRDDEGKIFGVEDIINLLEERTPSMMRLWEIDQEEFKKKQDVTVEKIQDEIEFGKVVTTPVDKDKKGGNKVDKANNNAMTI